MSTQRDKRGSSALYTVPNDPNFDRQWALHQCRFPDAWPALERGPDPGPIAVIDLGLERGHPDLAGRITKRVSPRGSRGESAHALAVCGIVSAIRDNGEGIAGCCSAKLHVYNVWPSGVFNRGAYYRALTAALDDRVAVLNISVTKLQRDEREATLIRQCVEAGIVVVAPAGNDYHRGNWPVYPAAYSPDVIAVGATGTFDRRSVFSNTGPHLWLSAPGEDILSTSPGGQYAQFSGTSYAAPMVAAAAWLARRARPDWDPATIRSILARSVDRAPGQDDWNEDVGHGRLNVVKLATFV